MNDYDFKQDWDKVVAFFNRGLDLWNAQSSERQVAIVFSIICLINFGIIWFYRRALKRSNERLNFFATAPSESCGKAQQSVMSSGLMDAYNKSCAVDKHSEFAVDLLGKSHAAFRESLDAMRVMSLECNHSVTTGINGAIAGLGEQFVEVLEKIAAQQANSNKLLSELVGELAQSYQTTHSETMQSVNNLVNCVQSVFTYKDKEDDDE